MELTFTPVRIGIFLCLLIAYWFLDGFTHPATRLDIDGITPYYLLRIWVLCMTLFIAGAASATLIEHWAGNLDPTNLQALYIVFGVLLIAVAVAWNHSLGTNPVIG